MKKFISVLTAVVMAMTMLSFATTAMAVESPTAPTATTETTKKPPVHDNFTVNGETTTDITFTPGDKENEFIFDYVGDGKLEGWDNNFDDFGLVEGVDYVVVINDDGSMSITFISDKAIDLWNANKLQINAIVKDATPSETTTKKDDSNKSPDTGISTTAIAGTVAVLGAGIAVLAATKKKDAE